MVQGVVSGRNNRKTILESDTIVHSSRGFEPMQPFQGSYRVVMEGTSAYPTASVSVILLQQLLVV